MKFFSFEKSFQRARLVSFFTDASSMLYHILVQIIFFKLKIYPMAMYNIVSVSVFAIILHILPKLKTYEIAYFFGLLEVIIHQILADYFMGTDTCFHYFILLTGLLPFFIFEKRIKLSIPVAFFSVLVFIALENTNFNCKFDVSPAALIFLKNVNIFISVFLIVMMIIIYTILVFKTEANLELQNKKLEKEIKMASVIQQSFFKQDTTSFVNYSVAYYSRPMAGVSGDIYDFYSTNNQLEGIGIFDVSGHGISSGLVTMLVKNIIHQEFHKKKKHCELWEILNSINDRVITEKGDIENYLTGILLRVMDEKLEIATAGHPMPIIYHHETGKCEFLTQNKHSIGVIGLPEMPVYYYSDFIDFNKGDEIFLYTDGITDMENMEGKAFGADRLLEIVQRVCDLTVEQQVKEIASEIKLYRNEKPQNDDITFVILRK